MLLNRNRYYSNNENHVKCIQSVSVNAGEISKDTDYR